MGRAPLMSQGASELQTWKQPSLAPEQRASVSQVHGSAQTPVGESPTEQAWVAASYQVQKQVPGHSHSSHPCSPHHRSRSKLPQEAAHTGVRTTGLCAPAASTSRRLGPPSPLPTWRTHEKVPTLTPHPSTGPPRTSLWTPRDHLPAELGKQQEGSSP